MEWLSKLNRKLGFHVLSIPLRFFATQPLSGLSNDDHPARNAFTGTCRIIHSIQWKYHYPDTNTIDRANQNETVINALTGAVVTRIPLGIDGQWGDDVGHVKFDPGLHRIFVVVQQLADPNSPNPNLLPPPGTASLVAIDPITSHVIARLKLPDFCFTPHGLAIDTGQHIAFIACVNADPPSLVRVDLQTMKALPEPAWPVEGKPDIIALDRPLYLVYVACGAGISLFQEEGRNLKWLGNYTFGLNTHTIAVNEQTHEIYLPLVRVGNRPVLRIMRYNPNAAN